MGSDVACLSNAVHSMRTALDTLSTIIDNQSTGPAVVSTAIDSVGTHVDTPYTSIATMESDVDNESMHVSKTALSIVKQAIAVDRLSVHVLTRRTAVAVVARSLLANRMRGLAKTGGSVPQVGHALRGRARSVTSEIATAVEGSPILRRTLTTRAGTHALACALRRGALRSAIVVPLRARLLRLCRLRPIFTHAAPRNGSTSLSSGFLAFLIA